MKSKRSKTKTNRKAGAAGRVKDLSPKKNPRGGVRSTNPTGGATISGSLGG